MAAMAQDGGLLERGGELHRLGGMLDAAVAGLGTAVLVRGPAGIGKTALLEAVGAAGRGSGMLVLEAAGAELERDLAFGVARQLFERHLRRSAPAEREALLQDAAGLARAVVLDPGSSSPRTDVVHAAMHGLYWLAAELAARDPVLLVVDDAHWPIPHRCDGWRTSPAASTGLPLLLVVAARDAEPGTDAELLEHVSAEAGGGELRPRPLSRQAIESWLERSYGERPERRFTDACASATNGNPFLLSELTATLRAEHARPDAAGSDRVQRIAPATVSAWLRVRLGRLGPAAVTVAEVVAVLSTDARLDRVAVLADLPLPEVGQVVDRLTAAEILVSEDPVAFAHPLLRSAVYDRVPAERRGLLHLEAARGLLAGPGAEQAAPHLLVAAPSGLPWVVDALRQAAATAVARGAPEAAVPLLRRGLDEAGGRRADLLVELAAAEATAQDPAAVDHARAAVELAATPEQYARAALIATGVLVRWGRMDEALVLLDAVEDSTERLDPATRRELRVATVMVSAFWSAADLHDRLAGYDVDRLAGDDRAERALLALRAMDLTISELRREDALRLARLLLAREDPLAPANEWMPTIVSRVLALGERADEGRDYLDAFIRGAQARGAAADAVAGYAVRAEIERHLGRLREAEADARQALQLTLEPEVWALGMALGILVDVLVERTAPVEGLAVVASYGLSGRPPAQGYPIGVFLHARGRARVLAGDAYSAAADFRDAGRIVLGWGELNPATVPWRSSLALALHALEQAAEARALVDEELELARRFGAARPVGIALRARALLEGGAPAIGGLREAVEVLGPSPARLEHARALVDLGAALRRAGHRTEARSALEEGLDLAHRCGAHRLTARAREELRAAGARPRRERLSGVEALTASELRVARMAAEGMTNRQIAQALFVTTKTVEMHLGRAFAKLGVARRTELAAALAATP
jgi:DNA-binding CsgD family transcriptional regulator